MCRGQIIAAFVSRVVSFGRAWQNIDLVAPYKLCADCAYVHKWRNTQMSFFLICAHMRALRKISVGKQNSSFSKRSSIILNALILDHKYGFYSTLVSRFYPLRAHAQLAHFCCSLKTSSFFKPFVMIPIAQISDANCSFWFTVARAHAQCARGSLRKIKRTTCWAQRWRFHSFTPTGSGENELLAWFTMYSPHCAS